MSSRRSRRGGRYVSRTGPASGGTRHDAGRFVLGARTNCMSGARGSSGLRLSANAQSCASTALGRGGASSISSRPPCARSKAPRRIGTCPATLPKRASWICASESAQVLSVTKGCCALWRLRSWMSLAKSSRPLPSSPATTMSAWGFSAARRAKRVASCAAGLIPMNSAGSPRRSRSSSWAARRSRRPWRRTASTSRASSSGENSLLCKNMSAPEATASRVVSVSPYAETMMTGCSSSCRRISRSRSSPSRPDSRRMSRITRSKRLGRNCERTPSGSATSVSR
ncbi:MAG: hypothetical protein BWY99_02325 [Synergistetes bacterium ADurb.BinA166]|nr:MAG: hypothetical protein BWY99_02325 [Synergistetes bacterium ADurb.BinA166]